MRKPFNNKLNCHSVSTPINKNVIDFLVSDDFINYIINPNNSNTREWEEYFKRNPEKIPFANQASKILNGESDIHFLPSFEMKELEIRIFEKCGLSPMN